MLKNLRALIVLTAFFPCYSLSWNLPPNRKPNVNLISPKIKNANIISLVLSSIIFSQTPLMTQTTNFLISCYGNSNIKELSDVSWARPEGIE